MRNTARLSSIYGIYQEWMKRPFKKVMDYHALFLKSAMKSTKAFTLSYSQAL